MTFGRIKIDAADKQFSLYIRKKSGWTCAYCKREFEEGDKRLTCSHFFGRRMESVRFDSDNCDALCISCHMKLETEKGETTGTHNGQKITLFRAYKEWKFNQLGADRFERLEVRAHAHVKKDRKMVLIQIKALLRDLEKTSNTPFGSCTGCRPNSEGTHQMGTKEHPL